MPTFDGLNLTWETLEGLVKHNGPLTDRAGSPDRPLCRARDCGRNCRLQSDAMISNFGASRARRPRQRPLPTILPTMLTTSTTACGRVCSRSTNSPDLPVAGDILREVDRQHPRLDGGRRAHEFLRRLITRMIDDVISEARRRLTSARSGARERHSRRGDRRGRVLGRHGAGRPGDQRLSLRRACIAMRA